MENSTKQIDSCIKMFALLKLLLEDNANFNQVVKVITDGQEPGINDSSIYSVTLNKYLNTLKIFGLNVKKEKGKYYLLNPLFKINLNAEELKAFQLIKRLAESAQVDEQTQEELGKIIKAFELRFSENTQMLARANASKHKANFSFYYETSANKIDTCTKFCAEDFKVEIIYFVRNGVEKKIICNAKELCYRRKTILLQVIDLHSSEIKNIPMDKIISLKQLPAKTLTNIPNKVVVFGIRGRLAKNYKLRKWEYIREIENGWHIVVNKDENEEDLIKRILKYGDSCKVCAPLDFKNRIRNTFNDILKLYEIN